MQLSKCKLHVSTHREILVPRPRHQHAGRALQRDEVADRASPPGRRPPEEVDQRLRAVAREEAGKARAAGGTASRAEVAHEVAARCPGRTWDAAARHLSYYSIY